MKKVFTLSIDEEMLCKLRCLAAYKQFENGTRYSITSVINEAVKKYLNQYEDILEDVAKELKK